MDYKAIAQQANQEVLSYNQDTSGWKLVKASKKITVFSKASRRFLGSLYRVEGVIPEPTSKLSDFLYQPGNRVKWDKSLQVHSMVHRIDSETFICHTITQSFAFGSISPRDFIDLIHIKHYDGNMDIISSNSVDFPDYPPSSNYIRGFNHPCGYVCSPLKENPAYSKLVMYVQTEMRGKLTPSIIERTMPSNLVSFVLNAKDGIKSYRPSSAHEHYNSHSSFQRKKGRSSIKS
ncbi:stAR-related lipid transfer protein 6 isoform X1 [Dipodomys merriami]|uniref:stAR-related lipid transfer protein 6 isoform X1 n=1 Tax=Dipodomys merriami TaxID=94247 RepID=UPI003855D067